MTTKEIVLSPSLRLPDAQKLGILDHAHDVLRADSIVRVTVPKGRGNKDTAADLLDENKLLMRSPVMSVTVPGGAIIVEADKYGRPSRFTSVTHKPSAIVITGVTRARVRSHDTILQSTLPAHKARADVLTAISAISAITVIAGGGK